MLFWQQSLGEEVDVLLSPAPVHKHHGGMIQDCYGKPDGLYRRLCERIGRKFNLMRYWGPLASFRVGDWIAAATAEVMADAERAPQLLLTYLPSLDYDLQRYGPDHDKTRRALAATLEQLARLRDAANRSGYEIVIYGDYAIAPCERAVLPNRALAEAGLLATRTVRGMQYPDFHAARALAVVDHEVAHVYVRNKADLSATKDLLAKLDGVAEVFDEAGKPAAGLDHPNSGELVLIAEPGSWFAYPWWTGRRAAPDFASHVDIHNKPGFDPCELFFGFPPMSVSRDTGKVRGSHGRTGDGREIAWTSSIDLGREIGDIVDLASAVKAFLES
jgi:predicted AlkP superfamily pyrophosphatase or phosphodiesterase